MLLVDLPEIDDRNFCKEHFYVAFSRENILLYRS